ncbi:hypothetical protein AMTR_s00029p00208210 [Amborella trichopoda]|uniref:Uncharacterized protein n=1 Tax=Amborella trichopoda TaxID=13333 RepID=W1PNQ0_AMBTC|nr:hypothetical protein AMTR_s00029p00208210 [Amborella trichopoda]
MDLSTTDTITTSFLQDGSSSLGGHAPSPAKTDPLVDAIFVHDKVEALFPKVDEVTAMPVSMMSLTDASLCHLPPLVNPKTMYPLVHSSATHWVCNNPIPSFDPLAMDPLVVVINEEEEGALGGGTNALGPLDEEGEILASVEEDLSCAMVPADHLVPLNSITQEERTLLVHSIAAPHEALFESNAIMEDPVDPVAQKVESLAADCGMDFNILIGVVFQEIIAKKKVERMEALAKQKIEYFEKDKDNGVQADLAQPKSPSDARGKSKCKGKGIAKGTRSSVGCRRKAVCR